MPDAGTFLGKLFGSTVAGAANPAAAIIEGTQKFIGMFKLSPELKAQLQAQLTAENIDLEKIELAANLAQVQGQLDINKKEAESTNWWVAGWRPGAGWVCVFGLAYAFVVQPFAIFVLSAFHVTLGTQPPMLDTGVLIRDILIPMLGLGALRTVEKVTGTEGNR